MYVCILDLIQGFNSNPSKIHKNALVSLVSI